MRRSSMFVALTGIAAAGALAATTLTAQAEDPPGLIVPEVYSIQSYADDPIQVRISLTRTNYQNGWSHKGAFLEDGAAVEVLDGPDALECRANDLEETEFDIINGVVETPGDGLLAWGGKRPDITCEAGDAGSTRIYRTGPQVDGYDALPAALVTMSGLGLGAGTNGEDLFVEFPATLIIAGPEEGQRALAVRQAVPLTVEVNGVRYGGPAIFADAASGIDNGVLKGKFNPDRIHKAGGGQYVAKGTELVVNKKGPFTGAQLPVRVGGVAVIDAGNGEVPLITDAGNGEVTAQVNKACGPTTITYQGFLDDDPDFLKWVLDGSAPESNDKAECVITYRADLQNVPSTTLEFDPLPVDNDWLNVPDCSVSPAGPSVDKPICYTEAIFGSGGAQLTIKALPVDPPFRVSR